MFENSIAISQHTQLRMAHPFDITCINIDRICMMILCKMKHLYLHLHVVERYEKNFKLNVSVNKSKLC